MSTAISVFHHRRCVKVRPKACDMITANLQVKKADNADLTVIAALPGITGADGDALVLGTELYGCHSVRRSPVRLLKLPNITRPAN